MRMALCLFLFAALHVACGSPSASSQHAIGGACATSADCQAGLTCNSDPGGQCVKDCASDGDCGAGAVCTGEKKCYKACASSTDCRPAPYACVQDSGKKFCDVVATPTDLPSVD